MLFVLPQSSSFFVAQKARTEPWHFGEGNPSRGVSISQLLHTALLPLPGPAILAELTPTSHVLICPLPSTPLTFLGYLNASAPSSMLFVSVSLCSGTSHHPWGSPSPSHPEAFLTPFKECLTESYPVLWDLGLWLQSTKHSVYLFHC